MNMFTSTLYISVSVMWIYIYFAIFLWRNEYSRLLLLYRSCI